MFFEFGREKGRFSRDWPELAQQLEHYLAEVRGGKKLSSPPLTKADSGLLDVIMGVGLTWGGNAVNRSLLQRMLKKRDESFSQMLLRKIEESGMSSSECYKKALVDRKLFSKIRSDPGYRPSRETVLAFAIALELDLEETNRLMKTAGYTLSNSRTSDIIVRFFIEQGIYQVDVINAALLEWDQVLLGIPK